MEQDNVKQVEKHLDVLHVVNMRDLVLRANSMGIQKNDIVQIVPATEGFFLLYYI